MPDADWWGWRMTWEVWATVALLAIWLAWRWLPRLLFLAGMCGLLGLWLLSAIR